MISIITSLYRSDAHIRKYQTRLNACAVTLLAHNVPFEVICIANDATELEKKVGEELSINSWFHFHNVPRESLYATWNRGVNLAQGTACTPWNVDDKRFPDAIIEGHSLIESGTSLVYFPFIYKRYIKFLGLSILAKCRVIMPPEFDRDIFMHGMHCGPFFIFSKSLFEKIGPFDETFKIAGDYDWCVRAALYGNFMRGKECGGIFRNDGTTLSGSRNNLQQQENARVAITATKLLS